MIFLFEPVLKISFCFYNRRRHLSFAFIPINCTLFLKNPDHAMEEEEDEEMLFYNDMYVGAVSIARLLWPMVNIYS